MKAVHALWYKIKSSVNIKLKFSKYKINSGIKLK